MDVPVFTRTGGGYHDYNGNRIYRHRRKSGKMLGNPNPLLIESNLFQSLFHGEFYAEEREK